MNQNFVDFMSSFAGQKLAVAVSGGVDSVCLLHWVAELGLDVVALHVNHGLRDVADTEMNHVRGLAEKLAVPFQVFYWNGEKPTSGLEAAARNARYKMMTDYCKDNEIKVLLTAHQADDQIETFLMNLGRGSGVYGLGAMRAVSKRDETMIVRPLLTVGRAELINYCNNNQIKYFSDKMNDDDQYTRVRIRKNRHLLNDKLGISDQRLLLAIQNLSRTRDAMDASVLECAERVLKTDYAVFMESFLFDEPLDIRLKLLSCLIQKLGKNDYPPRLNSLENALDMLGNNCKFTLGHCTLRRLGNKILIVPEGHNASFQKRY